MAQKVSRPTAPYKSTQPAPADAPVSFIFDKGNYIFFIVAIAVVALGFFLMAGTTDIYSNTKIVVAPVVVLIGFGIGFYAILKKPSAKA